MVDEIYLEHKFKEIQELYINDDRPWIIGYSGGKDSTATLQLIYYALSELEKSQLQKNVWVITNDTLVEIPTVVDRVDSTLSKINKTASKNSLPISAVKTKPDINSSFFVNLIGRGYPSPTRTFRWCTERLKISPTNEFIKDKVSEYGEVIVILGSRKKESMSRAQTMINYEIKGSVFRKHTSLVNALVYTPIEDWELNDVWRFLQTFKSPWGDNNRDLVSLYKKAGGDECPVVIDKTTPSCGNSRFGCWVCTVVDQDKSINGFIKSGESWLQPMANFRNMIKTMREEREKYRVTDDSRTGGFGPFTLSARIKILTKLLEADKEVFSTYKQHLIKSEELWAIQKCWQFDGATGTAVADLYNKVYNKNIGKKSTQQTITKRNNEEIRMIDLCDEYGVDHSLIERLLFIEKDITRMRRRHGLYERMDRELNLTIKEK